MTSDKVLEHVLICSDCPKPCPGAQLTLVPVRALCPVGQALRWQQWDRTYGNDFTVN